MLTEIRQYTCRDEKWANWMRQYTCIVVTCN